MILKKILNEALKWMTVVLKDKPDDEVYLDTYANLLYKTGDRKNAIIWESKAIEMGIKNHAVSQDMNDFRTTREKMDKMEPTWQ